MKSTIKFLTDKPALLVGDVLVLADLHLGIEYELYKSGFSLPSSIEKIGKRIGKTVKESKAKKLILLGDIKHNVPEISYQEKKEIPKFLEGLSELVDVHIVPGNHDGNIDKLSPKVVNIHPRSGFILNNIYYNHGHSWPGKAFPKSKLLIMGHSHPAIEFRDSLGYRYVEPCWLKCEINKNKLKKRYGEVETTNAIIVPAFNPMISGMPVNNGLGKPFIGPLMRNNVINIKSSDAYLLDGTYLGKIKEL